MIAENKRPNTLMAAMRHFDPDTAAAFVASVKWPDGPCCPKCGSVSVPDRKVLFVRSTYERGRPVQYATIDGSAGTRSQSEARGGGYHNGDGLHDGSIHPADVHYYLHTIDGVRGRDLRD